jgi:nucleoside-diphosphate-sugar epimerase
MKIKDTPFSSRIFVTGGSGFIGANLLRRLVEEPVEVHVIVKPQSNLWRIEKLLPRLFIHEANLENYPLLETIIQEISPSAIFHLAAHGVSSGHQNPRQILSSNLMGSFNLIQACKNIDYESFVYLGGSSEYGRSSQAMTEEDMLKPITFYGATKACSTLLLQQFAYAEGKPIAILRPFSVYGYYESSLRLIPTAIEAALKGRPLKLTTGTFSRDFVFVGDVAEACLKCWKKKISKEIINIGTGIHTTTREVIKLIEELTEKKIEIDEEPYPPHLIDRPIWRADITKARKMLGWKPHTLQQGLQKTIAWMQNENT